MFIGEKGEAATEYLLATALVVLTAALLVGSAPLLRAAGLLFHTIAARVGAAGIFH